MKRLRGRCVLLYGVLLIPAAGYSCNKGVPNMQLEKKRIIEIAKEEAQRRGYNLAALHLVEDPDHHAWSRSWRGILKHNPHLSDPTRERDFTAIYFEPKEEMQLGGDLWVLIDNHTGEILYVLPGK